jgi:hypothetical protein
MDHLYDCFQRSIAFGCFRGIVKQSPVEIIRTISEGMTRVAVRELTDEGVPSDLKLEAEKLTQNLRSLLGNNEYNALYARINDYYHQKRNENRAKKKETVSRIVSVIQASFSFITYN